jgi:hypothetical protein
MPVLKRTVKNDSLSNDCYTLRQTKEQQILTDKKFVLNKLKRIDKEDIRENKIYTQIYFSAFFLFHCLSIPKR